MPLKLTKESKELKAAQENIEILTNKFWDEK